MRYKSICIFNLITKNQYAFQFLCHTICLRKVSNSNGKNSCLTLPTLGLAQTNVRYNPLISMSLFQMSIKTYRSTYSYCFLDCQTSIVMYRFVIILSLVGSTLTRITYRGILVCIYAFM